MSSPGGVQYCGKHRLVLASGVGSADRLHCCGEYWTVSVPPLSLSTSCTRYLTSGGSPSRPSTRFGICTPLNVTSGSFAVPAGTPSWEMLPSHSDLLVLSPGSG